MRLSAVIAIFVGLSGAAGGQVVAQVVAHPGSNRPTSEAEIYGQIAWFGAICGGYGLGYNSYTEDAAGMTEVRAELAGLAAETGAALADLTVLAEARAAEFEQLFQIVAPSIPQRAPHLNHSRSCCAMANPIAKMLSGRATS